MAHRVHEPRKYYSLQSSKAHVSDNQYHIFPQYQKECSFRFPVSLSLTKLIDKSIDSFLYELGQTKNGLT